MSSYAAVDLSAQRTANTTEHGTAQTAVARATQRVVGCGRRSRGWSFRFGTLHQSCACTHRHRIWFLFCLSSQLACDFIPRRHQCLCFSRGMVPVPMVGLQTSQCGTASEVPPGEFPTHRHLLTHISRVVPQSTPPSSRGDILAYLFRDGTKPRCTQKEHWVLGDRNFVQKDVDSSTCNFGTSSEVLSRGFSTHCRLLISFSRAYAGSFPPGSCSDTSPHTGFEITPTPAAPRRRSEGHRSSARCAFGAFIGMTLISWCSVETTEENRWLQSVVVVPRVTPPAPGRRRHLRQRARRERRSRDRYRDAPALLPARTSSRGPLWTFSVSGLLRKKGKR